MINRSNPQSVISGLVFYYCRLIGKNITCSKFSNIVNLSDITVSRISKNIFFTSKGHDAPGVYAVMNAFGEIPDSKMLELRRLNGLPGHPEVGLFGIPTSTGSLGMGISKAKGFCYAFPKSQDKVVVLLGDGELQEGQIWEAAMYAAANKVDNVIATIDYNGRQIDGNVDDVLSLGNLHEKWQAFGWIVLEMDGHNFTDMKNTMLKAHSLCGEGKPVVIIMKTEMGQGVDYMMGSHKWHGVAPNAEQLESALNQLEETLGDY